MPLEQQIFVPPVTLPLFRRTMTSRDNPFFTLPKEFSIVKCFILSQFSFYANKPLYSAINRHFSLFSIKILHNT